MVDKNRAIMQPSLGTKMISVDDLYMSVPSDEGNDNDNSRRTHTPYGNMYARRSVTFPCAIVRHQMGDIALGLLGQVMQAIC